MREGGEWRGGEGRVGGLGLGGCCVVIVRTGNPGAIGGEPNRNVYVDREPGAHMVRLQRSAQSV